MIYTNDREPFRQAFFAAWQKHLKQAPTDALETQLIEIILIHPEYQSLLESQASFEKLEFDFVENPFLHMSLHMALREQINTNRPNGITHAQQNLLQKYHDAHEVEHRMMECLAEVIWHAQQGNSQPNEDEYLMRLKKL